MKRSMLWLTMIVVCSMARAQGIGGNGVPGASSAGANIPATGNLLKGAGSAGAATAATPGTDYVTPSPGGANQTINQTSGSTLGVTNLNKVFYVSGFPSSCTTNEGSFTTQLECAWFTVYDYAVSNSAMVYLEMGYGYYIVNHSLYEPTQSFTGISLIGAGMQGSVIVANAVLTDAVIYKNETAAGGTWPQITMRDFKILGNDQIQGCLRLWGIQEPIVENVNCINIPNGAPFLYQFGEPNNYAQGWVFQLKASNVLGGNSVSKPTTKATVTATVSGGAITGYVVSNGGAGYGAPTVEQVMQVYVLGNQNGTSDQPCTVMPTGLAATVSGGVIQTVTQTGGGTGCSGTITVQVVPLSNIAVGVDNWATDSMMNYLIPENTLIGVINHSGNVNYDHTHPTGTGVGIQSTGNVTFNNTEIDTNTKWGFDFLSGTTGATVEGTNTFGNATPLNMFHLASTAAVEFGPQSGLCVNVTPVDYHEFLMPYGTFEANGYLPAGSSVAANDTLCSNLGTLLQQPLTLPALAPATASVTTQSGNAFSLSSSAWIASAVANHKWTWQPTESSTGLFHSLTLTSPDPLNSTVRVNATVTAAGFLPQSGAAGPSTVLFDDYYSGANNASNSIGSPTGQSCAVNTTYTDINHPGNLLLTSGTGGSGTGITCGYQSQSPDVVTPGNALGWTWETAVYVPVLPGTAAGAYQAGLTNGPNVNPWTTGIQFYLSSTNGVANDWYCRYSATSTDTSVAAVVGWQRLTIVNDGTLVHWYIGGTQVCGTGVAIASMPTSNQYPASWSATALSATSVTMAVDYVDWQRTVTR